MGDDLEAIRAKRMAELQAEYGVTIFLFIIFFNIIWFDFREAETTETNKRLLKKEKLK